MSRKQTEMKATPRTMISVEEATAKVLSHVNVLPAVDCPLLGSLGLVLSRDIVAEMDVPPADNAAMDGFAVRAASVEKASNVKPTVLKVVAEVAAGHTTSRSVGPGEAIRIMTGAPVPGGADTVVPFELTDESARKKSGNLDGEIGITCPVALRANIRDAGEDVPKGSVVLSKGTVLRAAEIGVLASLGYAMVPVHRRPEVAIIATGDEVVDVSQPLPPGKIYNSNSYSIAAQVLRCGGTPRMLGVARDDKTELTEIIRKALSSDLVITSGGVSLGDYDMVKDVLAAEGSIDFWTVRMKPGKPLAFGVFKTGGREIPHLGLPGNPVSSMITFEMFARASILKMMGRSNLHMPTIEARLAEGVKNADGRRIFIRVRVDKEGGEFVARSTGAQGSGVLTSMARANGLAIIPEDVREVPAGAAVEVMMPDWNEVQA